jgi:hypothetical protein
MTGAGSKGGEEVLFRVLKITNRYDPEYDTEKSAGYRDVSLNLGETPTRVWPVHLTIYWYKCPHWAT